MQQEGLVFCWNEKNKQTNKQTSKQTNKQTNKQANKYWESVASAK